MIEITVAHNEARLEATRVYIDTGSSPAKVQVYSGSRPALAAAPTGILLAEIPLSSPCGAITANKLVLDTPVEGLILASGSASWARIRSRSADVVADCDIGEVNSAGQVVAAGDLLLNSLTLFAGGTLRLVSGQLG